MKERWIFIIVFGLVVAAVVLVLWQADVQRRTRKQPVAFSHKPHVALGIACAACHVGARNEHYASIPTIKACLLCHADDTTHPAVQSLRRISESGGQVNWATAPRLASHVNFSHRRHVGIAKLDCAACHGDVTQRRAAIVQQRVILKMNQCLACHRQSKVTTDCLACHR